MMNSLLATRNLFKFDCTVIQSVYFPGARSYEIEVGERDDFSSWDFLYAQNVILRIKLC